MNNQDQIDYWNGEAGEKWAAQSDRLDQMLVPFAQMIFDRADLRQGEKVLDIGCGAGALSLMAAKAGANVTGVDVSEPLLDLANSRTADGQLGASFSLEDAATAKFASDHDLILSRFGVMFFDDPVAAFSNLKSAMHDNGRMVFACWQPASENLWAMTPLIMALPFLKEKPEMPDPRSPGPFAFGDYNYLLETLESSGWQDIEIKPWSGEIILPGDNASESAAFMIKMGPLGRLLAAQEIDMAPIQDALTQQLEASARDDGTIALGGAIWLVSAKA